MAVSQPLKLMTNDTTTNTEYENVDAFITGVLNLYHANRLNNTLKEAGFTQFETSSYTDDIRGPKTVIRYYNKNWPYPGTIVLQKMDFRNVERIIPELKGKSFASVVTAYALPALKNKPDPRPMAILSNNVSPEIFSRRPGKPARTGAKKSRGNIWS